MTPREYLLSLNKPYVTFPDVCRSLGLDYNTLWFRCRDAPDNEKPEAHGAFRAGATVTWAVDAACDFAEHHQRYWEARQAARQNAK